MERGVVESVSFDHQKLQERNNYKHTRFKGERLLNFLVCGDYIH